MIYIKGLGIPGFLQDFTHTTSSGDPAWQYNSESSSDTLSNLRVLISIGKRVSETGKLVYIVKTTANTSGSSITIPLEADTYTNIYNFNRVGATDTLPVIAYDINGNPVFAILDTTDTDSISTYDEYRGDYFQFQGLSFTKPA